MDGLTHLLLELWAATAKGAAARCVDAPLSADELEAEQWQRQSSFNEKRAAVREAVVR